MGLRVMNIRNLNTASFEMNSVILGSKGKELLGELGEAITELTDMWKGAGAPEQINNLVNLYNTMSDGFNGVSECNVEVGKLVIDLNNAARFNGGVPEALNEVTSVKFDKVDYLPENAHAGIEIDVPRARVVISKLQGLKGKFATISNEFENNRRIIFNEWQDSDNHDAAEETYSKLSEYMGTVSETLDSVVASIETAILNYQNIG